MLIIHALSFSMMTVSLRSKRVRVSLPGYRTHPAPITAYIFPLVISLAVYHNVSVVFYYTVFELFMQLKYLVAH